MMWLKLKLIEQALPFVLGPLVYLLVRLLKQGSAWIDSRDPWLKRSLVVAVAAIVTAVSSLAGQPITCDVTATDVAACLGQFTPEVLKVMLGSGVAMFMHFLKKSPPGA